jgi:hypothetical protein
LIKVIIYDLFAEIDHYFIAGHKRKPVVQYSLQRYLQLVIVADTIIKCISVSQS